MLDFIDFPRGPLWHGDANNTHKTHTAMILAVSPRTISGFLNLKCGFDSRRGHGNNALRPQGPKKAVRRATESPDEFPNRNHACLHR